MSRAPHPGLYVHVPFCKTKCPYCDFYSEGADPAAIEAWLDALGTEARLYEGRFAAFDSLYLGGGTPSVLGCGQLSALMGLLRRHFDFAADTEATIELNPDDVRPEMLHHIESFGFNRISLGAQSLDDRELRFLGRRHSARQTLTALDAIRSLGFTNLGVDLIYGFEGQTEASWLSTLEQALSYRPEHISCYQLTVEEGTPFGKMRRRGLLKSTGEDEARHFFLLTSQVLESRGYIHYEISNFARSEELASRHNWKYWRHVPYLGLGPAAHSFQAANRWWNVRSRDSYCEALRLDRSPIEGSETLSPEQVLLEKLFLGFRTRAGVDLELVRGTPCADEALDRMAHSGLVCIKDDRVTPTLEGFLVADSLPLAFVH